jgi:hypothetical protein
VRRGEQGRLKSRVCSDLIRDEEELRHVEDQVIGLHVRESHIQSIVEGANCIFNLTLDQAGEGVMDPDAF